MRLAKISEEMKHDSPVFIVGEARSGTSILYRTLQKHTVFRPKEINLVETKILSYSSRSFLLKQLDSSNPLRYMLNDHIQYQNFLTSIKKILLLHKLLCFRMNLKMVNLVPIWWYMNLNHIVLRSYFYFAKKARGVNRIVEKTPGILEHSPKLLLAFPKCKLVYIYRHPLDVYTSYVKRRQIQPGKPWLELPLNKFCRMYRNDIHLALTYRSRMKQSLLLTKYEDFTQDPETEFARICTFLKIPFEQEAVVETDPDLTKWKPDPHLFGKITPKTKNWQNFISLEKAQYIENQLRTTMKKLKYETYTFPISSKLNSSHRAT